MDPSSSAVHSNQDVTGLLVLQRYLCPGPSVSFVEKHTQKDSALREKKIVSIQNACENSPWDLRGLLHGQKKNCSPEVFVHVKGIFKVVWPGLTPVATEPTQLLTLSCL